MPKRQDKLQPEVSHLPKVLMAKMLEREGTLAALNTGKRKGTYPISQRQVHPSATNPDGKRDPLD